MFGYLELLLYILLFIVVISLYAINFSQQQLPKLKEYIHRITAPGRNGFSSSEEEHHHNTTKLGKSNLRRRRRSLSYSRNNNRNEPDVQSMQQENINLKLKLKNLETQLTALKEKSQRAADKMCTKCDRMEQLLEQQKLNNSSLERLVTALKQETCELSEENLSLQTMLKEQQQIIKLALARILPSRMTGTQFCEEHKTALYNYTDTILSK
eukprot:TRINITY_DN11032_c0_g1_i1.p1 TRINITY_DN11032_c0_g1~~TRINITY_DN11032_c0_g1_i1.p1  ORF type:complete len:211 (-),score=51.10 TRINITY_DN11032_c0_g1_i1:100-732(-)